MSINFQLKCITCNRAYAAVPMYKCAECNGVLDLVYDYESVQSNTIENHKQLKQQLIFHDDKTDQIMGEGNTPLLALKEVGHLMGIDKLFGKAEFLNPTGSFKDRPVAAGIKKATQFGYDKVIVASSGNGASAVSAYAAKYGMKSLVIVPENTPTEKVMQSKFYGSQIIKIKGPYSNSFNLALQVAEKFNLYNLTTTFINPYTLEGDKGVAFEMHDQMDAWPDYIVVPIGAGPLLVGTYKGFLEMKRVLKLNKKLPKMVGVQATGCAPIARAFQEGKSEVIAEDSPQTIAGGIGDGLKGYAEDGTYTLEVIRKSGGLCVAVNDDEILEAQKLLAEKEGIFVEPSAATSLAAVNKIKKDQSIKNQSIALLLTGHGLKDMNAIRSEGKEIPVVEPRVDELEKFI